MKEKGLKNEMNNETEKCAWDKMVDKNRANSPTEQYLLTLTKNDLHPIAEKFIRNQSANEIPVYQKILELAKEEFGNKHTDKAEFLTLLYFQRKLIASKK